MTDGVNHRFSLHDKVALVTGGSRGLGLEMCRAFAEAGADVAVASRKLEPCESVAKELIENFGHRARGFASNVGRWADADTLFGQVLEEFGRIDILVNNAGMSPLYESLTDVTEALFDKVIAVNLRGPFRLSALVGSHMMDNGGGSIINVSSGAALTADPMALPYAAAKAAVNTLTAGFARAFAPHVRVNCIQPGPFMTDISKAWAPDVQERRREFQLGRGGEPHEVVGAALYFASDASSFVTGAVLPVDGGATLRFDPK